MLDTAKPPLKAHSTPPREGSTRLSRSPTQFGDGLLDGRLATADHGRHLRGTSGRSGTLTEAPRFACSRKERGLSKGADVSVEPA
jgi:hypothetical protein